MLEDIVASWKRKAGIFALSAGLVFLGSCAAKIQPYQFHNDFLRVEARIGAQKIHEEFLDEFVEEVKDKVELKDNYGREEKIAILETITDVLNAKNTIYHKVDTLHFALTPRKLKREIAEFIEKNDVDSMTWAQIDSLPGSDCAKKFAKEEYKTMKYKASPNEDFHFSDCLSNSLIFKYVGKKLGFPLKIVSSYEHAFIRWDADGLHDALNPDNPLNVGDINWETTTGEEKNDEAYVDEDHLPKESIIKGVYLKSLSDDEALSLGYFTLAYNLPDDEHSAENIANYKKVIELNPNEVLAYHNLGQIFFKKGDMIRADKYNKEAILLHPSYPGNYELMAKIYKKMGKLKEAEKYEKIVNELKFRPPKDVCVPWEEE